MMNLAMSWLRFMTVCCLLWAGSGSLSVLVGFTAGTLSSKQNSAQAFLALVELAMTLNTPVPRITSLDTTDTFPLGLSVGSKESTGIDRHTRQLRQAKTILAHEFLTWLAANFCSCGQ